MAAIAGRSRPNIWRITGWGSAAALLAAPFIAMQLHTEGVNWSVDDFIFAATIFAVLGGLLEVAVWKSSNGWYRAGVALGLLGFLLTIWVNLAVGIVGSEHNAVNQLFFVALLVGIAGACIAGFRPKGMSWSTLTSGNALIIAFVIATATRTDEPNVSHWTELTATGVLAAMFFASAWLFRRAAAAQSSSSS